MRSLSSDGKDGGASNIVNIVCIEPTTINGLTYRGGNNTLTWDKTDGATGYKIARKKTGQSSYDYFTTSNTYYVDYNVTPGVTYTYQVQGTNSGYCGSWSSSSSVSTVVKPTLTVSNKSNGIRAEWNKIPGAVKYRVYYKSEVQSGWSYAETLNEYYPLLNTVNNRKYAFQIFAVYPNGGGVYSDVKNITFKVPYGDVKPTLTVSNKSNGIRAEWNYFPGAIYYTIYYRDYNSNSWSSVTTKNTYYPFLNVQRGKAYCFQVQPVFSLGRGAYSDVKTIIFNNITNEKPMVTVNNRWNGIAVAWDAVSGATDYRVYYRRSNETNWKSADTQSTSYAFLNVNNFEEYDFQVQALFYGQGGAYSSVWTIEFITPDADSTLVSATKSSTGVSFKWNAVSGATGYRVAYCQANGDWQFINVSASTTSYWFSSSMLGRNNYNYFSVCPKFNGSWGSWSANEMVYFK